MPLLPRRLLPRLLRRIEHRPVVVLTGARQSGKTTLVRELLAPRSPRPVAYYTMDDPDERLRIAADPVRAIDRPDRLVVLDEVQKLPVLFDAVKLLADQGEGRRFLLLGSSRILLLERVRESLAGRAAILDLWPLGLSEKEQVEAPRALLDELWEKGPAALRGAATRDMAPERARRLRAQAEYALSWGGYPPLEALPDDVERREWLRDYRRSFLERDLADLGRVSDLDQFSRAQLWVAAHTGELLSYSALARDLGVAVNTARRFVRFLEVSYQVVLLEPFLPRIDRRLAKSPKVLWTDPGLARVLTARFAPGDGPLYETYVGAEIVKWCSFRDDSPSLHYFRVHGGTEVDLLLTDGRTLLPIECKASARAHAADARGVRSLLAQAGLRAERRFGLVVHRGREVAELDRDLWAVPDWLLFGAQP